MWTLIIAIVKKLLIKSLHGSFNSEYNEHNLTLNSWSCFSIYTDIMNSRLVIHLFLHPYQLKKSPVLPEDGAKWKVREKVHPLRSKNVLNKHYGNLPIRSSFLFTSGNIVLTATLEKRSPQTLSIYIYSICLDHNFEWTDNLYHWTLVCFYNAE